jgi:hypothetical protein
LEIYKAALQLRHDKKLFSVSTFRGSVKVRFNEGDDPITIRTVEELSSMK